MAITKATFTSNGVSATSSSTTGSLLLGLSGEFDGGSVDVQIDIDGAGNWQTIENGSFNKGPVNREIYFGETGVDVRLKAISLGASADIDYFLE